MGRLRGIAGRSPGFTRATCAGVAAAVILALLPACVGPAAALSLVPWTPLLSATLAEHSPDPEIRKQLNALQQKGDWAGMAKIAETHLALDPNDGDWLLVLGFARLENHEYPAAEQVLSRMTLVDPEDVDGWDLLAETQRLSGQPQAAERTLTHAMSIDSSTPIAPFLMGEVHRDAGRIDQALEDYRRSLNLDDEYAPSWYGLGQVFILKGRKADADDTVKILKKIDPKLGAELEQQARALK